MTANALKKRRQRERAAARRAQEAEADPGEAEEPETEEPETEEPEPPPTEADLPLPPGARPEFGSPHVPSFEPLGDAVPPPGLSVSAPSSSTTRASSGASRDTAWHRKWRGQLVGGGGREEFVEYSADKIIGLLSKLDDIIRQCGQKPLVTAESLRPAAVLTIDQMMPTRVDALLEKPIAHLALGILAIGGQAAGAVSQAKAKAKRGELVTPQPKPVVLRPVQPAPPPAPPPAVAAPVTAPSSAPEPAAPPAPAPAPVPWTPSVVPENVTPAF